MTDLNDMVIFAQVARLQGISAAARALRVPKSKVSRRMAALEEELGVRLLERSTRSVNLTEVGAIYAQHCQRIVEEAGSARESVNLLLQAPRGHLRISASVAVGQHLLAPHIGDFMLRYPEIELEIQLGNRRVDLIAEGFDVVIRIGELQDSSLVRRPLGFSHATLVAAPVYLQRHGRPKRINDLTAHRCLVMGDSANLGNWTLVDSKARRATVDVKVQAILNDLTMIRDVACAGGGIALLPEYLSVNALASGQLETVLPSWRSLPFKFYALYPSHRGATLKLRAWLDFIADKLGPEESR